MRKDRVHSIKNWIFIHKSLLLLNGFLLAFIFVMTWIKPVDRLKDYDISRQTGNTASSVLIYGNKSLTQTFVCREAADSFEICITAANGSYHGSFKVSLCDEQGSRIQSWVTDKLDLAEGWMGYTLDHFVMRKGETYCITAAAPQLDKANAVKISLGSRREKYSEEDQPVYKDGQLEIKGKPVEQTLCFGVYKDVGNGYFWIAVVVLFMTADFWWINQNKPIDKTAPWILAGLGMIMFFCFTPASGPDEVFHYYSAYEISNVILGAEDIGEVDAEHKKVFSVHDNTNAKFVYVMKHIFGGGEQSNGEQSDGGKTDDKKLYSGQLKDEESDDEESDDEMHVLESNGHRDRLGSPISHLAPAAGITTARLFGMNVAQLYTLARLFNLFFYIIMASAAVRLIPGKKELMFMISIMPMAMHQAVQTSYDVVINGLALVFMAYIMKLIQANRLVEWKDVFLCVLLLGLFGPVKVVYCILAFLFAALPRGQFQNGRDRTAKGLIVFLGTFTIVMLSKWQDLFPNLAGSAKRTIADNYSLSFVLEHPVRFLKLIMRTLENGWWEYMKGAAGSSLAGLRVTIPEYLVIGFMILLFLCAMNRDKDRIKLSGRQKMVICCAASAGIVLTVSAASSWNSYGAYYVAGMQGRYLIPFIMPMLFCIGSSKTGPGVKINIDINIDEKKLMYPVWFIEAGYIISIMSRVEF